MSHAGMFTASRADLLGGASLLGSAEIARGVALDADRTVSVLAVTPQRMRRIDTWVDATGFVTHAASPNPAATLVGSVCDRARAADLLVEIVGSLVGPLPRFDADEAVDLLPLSSLSPATTPPGVRWVVVLAVSSAGQVGEPSCTVIADVGGLALGQVTTVDRACRLDPCGATTVRGWIASLVGEPSRSLRDLLGD